MVLMAHRGCRKSGIAFALAVAVTAVIVGCSGDDDAGNGDASQPLALTADDLVDLPPPGEVVRELLGLGDVQAQRNDGASQALEHVAAPAGLEYLGYSYAPPPGASNTDAAALVLLMLVEDSADAQPLFDAVAGPDGTEMTTNGGDAIDVKAASQAMTASYPPDEGLAQDAVLARRDRLVVLVTVFGNTKNSWRDEARELAAAIFDNAEKASQ